MTFAIPTPAQPSLAIAGSEARFPVHRIYCIGRNYVEHAEEMGAAADRMQPMFFMKPSDALVTGDGDVRYPSATADLHHEVEMVVALGRGGRDLDVDDALACVFGYGVGLDLTRRDLQATAKAKRWPWDVAKGFDDSAPCSALRPASAGAPARDARLTLHVNGELRQQASIADMIFGVGQIVHALSTLWTLRPGDLIFTGTPAGVAALARGDRFVAKLDDIAELAGRII